MERNEGRNNSKNKLRRLYVALREPVMHRLDQEADMQESGDIALVGMDGSVFPFPQVRTERGAATPRDPYPVESTSASAFAIEKVAQKLQRGGEIPFAGYGVSLTQEALQDSDCLEDTTPPQPRELNGVTE